MASLVLSIIAYSAMMLIFKLIEKFKADIFQAIVINYITAAILGFTIMEASFSIRSISESSWFINAIIVGIAFISLFYLIGITAQKVGISAAAVANKMSVVIPVIFAFFLYNDSVTAIKIIGILLAITGVYLATKRDEKLIRDKKYLILPIILFLGSGLLDTFINYTEKFFLPDPQESLNFIPSVFSVAAILGGVVLAIKLISKPSDFEFKNILWGIILGFFNYASLYFLLQALKVGTQESSAVFTINNMGIVILSTVAAWVFFKEQLSKLNILGIVIALIAILLIAFS
jgi:drug/metabolite transporter (DMT)-like permease